MKQITKILIGIDLTEDEENAQDVEQTKSSEEKDLKLSNNIPNPEGDDDVRLPKDIVAKLLNKFLDEKSETSDTRKAIELLAASLERNASKDDRYIGFRPIRQEEIDPEDVLSTPAIFFTTSIAFYISDDKKHGRVIQTPYNRIHKFKLISRQIVSIPGNKNATVKTVSAFMTNSKKEAEFMRNHTLFGTVFFEKISEGGEISGELQDKLIQAAGIVAQMDDHTVIQRCLQMTPKIDVDTDDTSTLRRKLSRRMAESLLKDDEKFRNKQIESWADYTQKAGDHVAGTTRVISETTF